MIRVFFPPTETGGEFLRADVSPEMSQRGQRSDDLRPFLAQEAEPNAPLEGKQIPESIPVLVSELPKPPDPRPPIDAPEIAAPSSGKKPLPSTGRFRNSTLPAAVNRPQSPPSLQGAPEGKQVARFPDPSQPMPQDPFDPDHLRDNSLRHKPLQPGSTQNSLFGRVPLLAGDDLDKYAVLSSADQNRKPKQLTGVDTVISLNSKNIKYLSYFAHIKDRIEQVWSYPSAAVAHRRQGQLLLVFILQRSGMVKSVELLRSSGSKVLDKEAWDAIMTAGPFEPFPLHILQDELHIRARFSYILDTVEQRTTMQ